MKGKIMKKSTTILAAISLAATFTTAMVTPSASADTKACFIYVGPTGDFGWSYQHDEGRKAAEKALGVETAFLESVPEGADAGRAIERFARSGCNIIFTTSFGYMDATNKVAKKFPKVKFEHATGYKRDSDNVSTYSSKFYEGRYVIGQMAAKVSKTGVAGYIASFPIPEVVRGINAFTLGAQSINPDFKLKVIWVNTWFDPGKESDAAKTLIDQGADILTQHTDSTAPMQVAAERGVLAFGQASDQFKFGPKTQMTAIIDNWADYYIARIKAVMDDSWKSQDLWGGMAEEMVHMAPITNVPADVKTMAEATMAKIKSGELNPFAGPITKQDGSEWLKAGQNAEVGTLLGMNFYVKGVDDKLPK
jgi:basic membrane protein A